MNISLIGMPGSGKTSVAPVLAAALGMEWADTDGIIEKNYGSIADIFKNYGEERFRALETETLKSLGGLTNTVIATGGGCVLRPENVKILKSYGPVIYLKASVRALAERLRGGGPRPLLEGGAEKKLAALYAARANLYKAAADAVIRTGGLSAEETVQKILEKIK